MVYKDCEGGGWGRHRGLTGKVRLAAIHGHGLYPCPPPFISYNKGLEPISIVEPYHFLVF